jgi:hypothetical protein
MAGDIDPKRSIEEREAFQSLFLLKTFLQYDDTRSINASLVKDDTIRFWLDDKDAFLITSGGNIVPKKHLVHSYDQTRKNNKELNFPDVKLFRSYHFKDSLHHLVSNDIMASTQYMYNKVVVGWASQREWKKGMKKNKLEKNPSKYRETAVQADNSIWDEYIIEHSVIEKNARDKITAFEYGLGNLWLGMREMYQGDVTILGDPSIKPYDIVFINDLYNDMNGPVEVEQVTHHFSPDTGFVTVIKPDLVCYVNSVNAIGSTSVANAYNLALTSWIRKAKMNTNAFTLGLGGGIVEGIVFGSNRFSTARREPINFTPLIYEGAPYLAGVEGMDKEGWIQATTDALVKFKDKHWEAAQTLGRHMDVAINRLFSEE